MTTRYVSLNGRIVPEENAALPVRDRAILFGDGVFETLRSYGGRVLRLESHLERLKRSLAGIEMSWVPGYQEIEAGIRDLLEANALKDARIRLTVTGGPYDGAIRLRRTGAPNVLLTADPLVLPDPPAYERGVALHTARFRQPWDSPLARIKTIHRLEYLMAREEALRSGADDALILDDRGNVAEGSSSNIFLFLEDTLVTPSLDSPILPGVTRDLALEAGRAAGFPTVERPVSPSELWSADEVFVTATSWEIMAVRSVDGRTVGGGGRGCRTELVHGTFRRIVAIEVGQAPSGQ